MKIGILGGTFDPPHVGHLIAASQIKERMKFDQMWLMPVASHAFDKKLSSAKHRLKMTEIVSYDGILASDYEIKLGGVSSTYHTMKYLHEEHPDDTFYFCMGSDLLADFHKWNDWEALVEENNFVIYPRGRDYEYLEKKVQDVMGANRMSHITIIAGQDVVITNVSSTLVRSRLKKKQSVKYLVPEEVISYITTHNLYK
ncbi:nicotinate (nicotinamide) nucleotide adenylyltransferase [Candidatus Roizmanbacteria bacterium]|nr:MAG: nicotinate (nicotinamide) nucleotide adenylyltransferase [Candidatus Roizmanbacteria bacterium]